METLLRSLGTLVTPPGRVLVVFCVCLLAKKPQNDIQLFLLLEGKLEIIFPPEILTMMRLPIVKPTIS